MLKIQELQVQGSNNTDQIHLSDLTPEELLLTGGGLFDNFPNFNKFVVPGSISVPSNQKPISVSGFPDSSKSIIGRDSANNLIGSNILGQGF